MTNEEYILDWFQNHVWARPKPSKICDGVGMFAIRNIPKGTNVYDLADKGVCAWIPWKESRTPHKGDRDPADLRKRNSHEPDDGRVCRDGQQL